MKKRLLVCLFASLLPLQHLAATSYTFDLEYEGSNFSTLQPGSDDPIGTMLFDGDDFTWNIQAAGSAYWQVVATTDYFPLMAFAVEESGKRTGDFTLTLSMNGSSVFSHSEFSSEQEEVHVGTNGIDLAAGLMFDQMHLSYSLLSATDLLTGDPVDTTLRTVLPIFGAPEMNSFSPGINYVTVSVPEAGAVGALLLPVIGLLGALRRLGRPGRA